MAELRTDFIVNEPINSQSTVNRQSVLRLIESGMTQLEAELVNASAEIKAQKEKSRVNEKKET